MNGHRAYQHYIALKSHYSKDAFSVFETPLVPIPEATFLKRNDRGLWDKLARDYGTEILNFMVSNMAYGNTGFLYNPEDSHMYYTNWIRTKQSITKVFEDEVTAIAETSINLKIPSDKLLNFDSVSPPALLNMYLGKHVSLETMVILNSELNYINDWKGQMSSFFTDEIRRIDKSQKFIKFNKEKVREIIASFKTDLGI